jgi:oligosaccharyltransferase complex subunit delta (ribophorin II)
VKDNGKAKVDLVVQWAPNLRNSVVDFLQTQKDLPTQFLKSSKPIDASLVIATFGQTKGYNDKAFSLSVVLDPNAPIAVGEKPLRYGKQPEIHHIFRSDPKSPNIIITLIFTGAVLAALPMLIGTVGRDLPNSCVYFIADNRKWLYLGANLNHLSKAMQQAPISHATFYSSIICIEGIFFMYYTSWNLFKTLPVLFVVGTIAFLSGSRALSEVQERRLAGMR